MSASPSYDAGQFHPEFGYFAPTMRFRSKVWLALKAVTLGVLAGAVAMFFLTMEREEKALTMLATPVTVAPVPQKPAQIAMPGQPPQTQVQQAQALPTQRPTGPSPTDSSPSDSSPTNPRPEAPSSGDLYVGAAALRSGIDGVAVGRPENARGYAPVAADHRHGAGATAAFNSRRIAGRQRSRAWRRLLRRVAKAAAQAEEEDRARTATGARVARRFRQPAAAVWPADFRFRLAALARPPTNPSAAEGLRRRRATVL